MTGRLQAVAAIARRDYDIARSYRAALALDVAFGFLNVVVYYFISRTFDGLPTTHLDGAPDYFAFAVVGLAVTLVIQSATLGVARRLREEQLVGTLEILVAQPVSTPQLAFGLAGFPFTFALVRACAYLLFSALVFDLSLDRIDVGGVAVVLAATGIAVTAFGIAVAAVVVVFKRGESIALVATFALGLVSGAVFPVSVLPRWMEVLGVLVPTRYAFEGLRAALFRGSGYASDVWVLLGAGAVMLPLAVAGFTWSIRAALRSGGLGQY